MKKQAQSPTVKKPYAKNIPIAGPFTTGEVKQIYAAAAKLGTSQSEFVRSAMLLAAEKVNFTAAKT